MQETVINIAYWADANATLGSYTLSLTTLGGTTSIIFNVGDATPVITSVSPPGPWQAGTTFPAAISGSHFGTAAPTVKITGAGNSTFSVSTNTDQTISGQVTIDPSTTSPVANLQVVSNGYENGFQSTGGSVPNSSSISVSIIPVHFNLSPSPFYLSTGDTGKTISISTAPAGSAFTSGFQWQAASNPNSSCQATLNVQAVSGTSSANAGISAASPSCTSGSDIWNVSAAVNSNNTIQVIVPPQIMIKMLVGEAGAQTGPGDMSQLAILESARNRFGDALFPGGSSKTWQGVLIPSQYYGASNGVMNGPQPELNNAAFAFKCPTGVSVGGAKAYWSPKNSAAHPEWANLQSALNNNTQSQAMNWSATGAPVLWLGQYKQAIIKNSVANNNSGGEYTGAKAFVFFTLAPSAGSPAVITIP